MSRLIVFLLIVGLLAACGQPGSTALPTATSSVLTQPIPTVLAPTQPAPTGTPSGQLTKAPFVSIAVRAPDDVIQIVNTQVPVDPRPVQITTGMWPLAGVVSGTVYALDRTQPRVVAMDHDGTRTLDFIQHPYGLAVLSGDQPRLGWATSPSGECSSSLLISAPDGSQLTTLLTDTMPITAPHIWMAQRWSSNGQSLYFSTEPCDMGGYILFGGASSLYRVNVNDRSVQEIMPFSVNGDKLICINELSSDDRLIADHCAMTSIAIHDLSSGQATTIQPPADVTGSNFVGSARFSPDLTRVAFALAKGDPNAEQGWVAVSDSLSGPSKLIATDKPGRYFTVAGWLNADTLLLQSNSLTCNPTCTNSLWVVKVDGSGLTHITDGTFLTMLE